MIMKFHCYYVYILANAHNTVLYIGITNDLVRRCLEHKQKKACPERKRRIKGFTQKYNVDKLVFFEMFDYVDLAIAREKVLKGYSRAKKDSLINSKNAEWVELSGKKEEISPSSK